MSTGIEKLVYFIFIFIFILERFCLRGLMVLAKADQNLHSALRAHRCITAAEQFRFLPVAHVGAYDCSLANIPAARVVLQSAKSLTHVSATRDGLLCN